MSLARVQYPGVNGTQDSFAVPFPYLERSHVVVYVNGEVTILTKTFTSSATIQLIPAPAAGSLVEIRRETPNQPLVTYFNTATLTAADLNLSTKQAMYLLQEQIDALEVTVGASLTALAANGGVTIVDPAAIVQELATAVLNSALLAELETRIADIDYNAEAILEQAGLLDDESLARLGGDNSLQTQINAIASATAGTVYVQPGEPVPGVSGVPNPIPDGARWYDSDDNNHPYVWDAVGLVWLDIEDPRIGANAADIVALDVRLDTAEGNITATSTALGVLDTTVTSINGTVTANSGAITALQSTVNNGSTGVTATAAAVTALTTRVTAAEGVNTSQGSAITALQSTVNDGVSGVAATAAGLTALTTRVTTAEGNITANSASITALQSTVNNGSTGVVATATALSALTTRVTATEGVNTSQSSSITALESTVNNGSTGVTATASALSSLTTRVTTAEGNITSTASSVTTLQTTVGGHTTSISTNATSIDGIQGKYTVKIDNNGHVSGYGLISTANNGVPTSEFIILADRFAIVKPGGTPGTPKVPFVVGTVAGVGSVVGIDGTLVVDGTIVANALAANSIVAGKIAAGAINASAAFANGVVTTAVIADAAIVATKIAAGVITASHIAANTITAGQIAAGTITAAQIAAGTITAAQLSVSSLSAISANIGTVTAGNIVLTGSSTITGDVYDLGSEYQAGTVILAAANTERFSTGTNDSLWTSVKRFRMKRKGVVRVVCSARRTNNASATAWPVYPQFRILQGATVLYTSADLTSTGYSVFTNDVTTTAATDDIYIEVKDGLVTWDGGAESAYIQAYIKDVSVQADPYPEYAVTD